MWRSVFQRCVSLLILTTLIGCACFQPAVKEIPVTGPGKEGETITVSQDMSLPCKIFWGTVYVLSWFLRGKSAEQVRREEEKERTEWEARHMRQYQGATNGR
jgi:hypothetical protein